MTHEAKNAASNFTILRLVLAIMVVLGHFRVSSAANWPSWNFSSATIAVDSFFVVSGYLISASFDRDASLQRYLVRRLFRIYPLYFAVIIGQAAIFIALSGHDASISVAHVLRYIVANLLFANFLQRDIGTHVLAGLSDPNINPSLWTLKIELGFYAVLPLIWWAAQRFGWLALAAIFLASAAYQFILLHTGHMEFSKQLPGQLQFFVLGVAAYRLAEWPRLNRLTSCALAASVTFLLFYARGFQIPVLYPLEIAVFVVLIATRIPSLELRSDFSYGVYLLHAPIIKLSLLFGLYRADWLGLGATFAIVMGLSLAAERLIETPGIAAGRWLTRRVGGARVRQMTPVAGN